MKIIKQNSWWRILQSKIRNSAAAESEGGQKFLPPNPLPFCPPESSGVAREARNHSEFRSKKVRAKCIITAPKLTFSEMTAPRGFAPALRRTKSAFVFHVKSQSSPQ